MFKSQKVVVRGQFYRTLGSNSVRIRNQRPTLVVHLLRIERRQMSRNQCSKRAERRIVATINENLVWIALWARTAVSTVAARAVSVKAQRPASK